MNENKDRNSSSPPNQLLSAGGVASSGAGLGVLTAHPGAAGRYVMYHGSNGKMYMAPLVRETIKESGVKLVEVNRRPQPIAPGQPGYAPNRSHLLGNSAVIDIVEELLARYGSRISDLRMGLSGPGLSKNMQPHPNGKESVQVDLEHGRWSPFSGNTNYIYEIKARNKIGGRREAEQAARLGEFVAARKALSAKPRLVGRSLQAGGLALQVGDFVLDHHLTQQEVERELAQGNTRGADLAKAGFWGRQAGGVLGNALTGAMLFGRAGVLGGKAIKPSLGTVALGTGGVLLGGLTGALAGEDTVKRLYGQWIGPLPTGVSEPLGTPEHDELFWEWGLR